MSTILSSLLLSIILLSKSSICEEAVPLYPDPAPKVPKPAEELHYHEDIAGQSNPNLIQDALKAMHMEHPKYESEENESASTTETKKKSKKDILIYRLTDPNHIIEDLTQGHRVVLFIENDKAVLKDDKSGEGLLRRSLISKLREERGNKNVKDTAFYTTSCEMLDHICHELNIDSKQNQVVYVTKYMSTPVSMKSPELVQRVWAKIDQGIIKVPDIDALNSRVDSSPTLNFVLFNFDPPSEASEAERNLQRERAMRLVNKCKKECLSPVEFVEIEDRDSFMSFEENKGRSFMMRKGELLGLPFKLRGEGKMGLNKTLKFINNEGLDDILENNNENYFRIFQNDLKAMIVLILNTDNDIRKESLLREFEMASRKHRQYRRDFDHRYTFVWLDLKKSEPHYRDMVLEITGDISREAELFIFGRAIESNLYENYSLSENLDEVSGFLRSIGGRIDAFKNAKEREDQIGKELDLEKNNMHDLATLEMGRLYLSDWEYLHSSTQDEEIGSQDFNVPNILGFLNSNDLGLLSHKFYKSAEEDRAYNDKNLFRGILQVTGNNLDRLVYNLSKEEGEYKQINHSFILVVCRNLNDKHEKDCQRLGNLIRFLRTNFPREEAEIRIGLFDQKRNDHPAIERFDIKSFPAIIFFGKKDETGTGKIFRGKLIVDKLYRWLNKKFIKHEDAIVELDESHYLELLLQMAKTKE